MSLLGEDCYVKQKPQDNAETNKYYYYAKKCLKSLYKYSLESFIHSIRCPGVGSYKCTCSQSKKGTELEMVDFSNSKSNVEIKERKESESDMREAVNCHYQSHLKKWNQDRIFPWKVVLHLLLVVLVTVQVFVFARDNSKFTRFLIGNEEAFDRYFKQRTFNEEGIEKLYMLQDVYNQIALIADSYYNISKQAVGSFEYVREDGTITSIPPNLTMEIFYHSIGCGKDESNLFPYKSNNLMRRTDIFPRNTTNPDPESSGDVICCSPETSRSNCSMEYCDCGVEEQINCYINENLNSENCGSAVTFTSNFSDAHQYFQCTSLCCHSSHYTVFTVYRIDKIKFNFTLFAFFRNNIIEDDSSVHAQFNIRITLVNDQFSSMTLNIDLESDLRRYCDKFKEGTTVVDIVILIILLLSSITYVFSLIKTWRLTEDLKSHFLKDHVETKLHWTVIMTLYNKWYLFMLFTNLIISLAIVLKIIAEYKVEISIPLVEAVRVLLGVGIFLLWCGLFGLLSYFDTLNELFTTIQLAFPRIWRFSICILILFVAFVLSGWLVLGPYHPKFRDFGLSVESLYCMLNGDDLYATFEDAHFNSQSYAIKLFSELYLVSFIFIFIYIVLSLFIGIFNQAYESLSEHDSHGTIRQWAEAKQENSTNAVPTSSNANIRETKLMSNDDSTVLQNEHLQSNVATPFEDSPNLHSITVDLESQSSNIIDVPGESKSEDDDHGDNN